MYTYFANVYMYIFISPSLLSPASPPMSSANVRRILGPHNDANSVLCFFSDVGAAGAQKGRKEGGENKGQTRQLQLQETKEGKEGREEEGKEERRDRGHTRQLRRT
jgi:hypothetical protein